MKIFVAIVSVLFCLSNEVQAQAVEAPKVVVGDEWHFENRDEWKKEVTYVYSNKITKIENDIADVDVTIISSKDSGQIGKITKSKVKLSTLTFIRNNYIEGGYVNLDFPLFTGKVWNNAYKLRANNGDVIEGNMTAKVHEWEDVNTSLGNIKALKVQHTGNVTRSGGANFGRGIVVETLWYSPEYKRVVKRTFEESWGNMGSVKPLTNVGQIIVLYNKGVE